MKTIIATATAIVLALSAGAANATGFLNPVTLAAMDQVAKSSSNSKSAAANLNKFSNNLSTKANSDAGSDVTTNNSTDVEGSWGVALSFPPPAIGNGPWGSWAFGWGLVTSTYYEDEVVNSNVFSNLIGAYAHSEMEKSVVLETAIASYMCASEHPDIRAGGALILGGYGHSGCLTKSR